MSDEKLQQEMLAALHEIRDAQRAIGELLSSQQRLVEEQVKRSRGSVEESIALQKLALQRQRNITLIAVPGILVCIVAIAYLVIRYF